MKIKGYITYLPALLSLLLWSCADDTLDAPGYGKEGEPATISLKVEVPDMGEATSRTMMSDTETSQVNDLWIGIYNAATGERTFSRFYDRNHNNNIHLWWQIDDITTKSGRSYIVAVANSRTNFGVSGKSGSLTPLDELLENADTWNSYQNISVSLTMTGSVDRYTSDFPMSGIYYDNNNQNAHPSGDDGWVEANQTPSFISDGDVGLMPGYIHLRRLHSYVKFNIVAGTGVSVEPQSWRVVNVPSVSYLHEQRGNACDAADWTNAEVEESVIRKDFDNGSFDFYMMENKHEGISDFVTTYDDREKEYKNADKTNTGIYQSLCPSMNQTANNSASFVEINAKVRYMVDERTGEPTYSNSGIPRIGFAKYTIHLGYCEGSNTTERARDFRHRRNTKYTYNVRIDGLKKIVVEAQKEGELKPGAEGDVIDLVGKEVEVDCHYIIYNVQFDQNEIETFEWRTRCPYGNKVINLNSINSTANELAEDQAFYQWVHIMEAPNENTPAKYNPNDAWFLTEMKGRKRKSPGNWYTVFIDENAYALNAAGNPISDAEWANSDWRKYVNQPDRMVWLGVKDIFISPDLESTYQRSKYLIAQKSIQTYCSDDMESAIGTEHINETFGLNFGWTWNNPALRKNNGRWNVWQYVRNRSWNDILQLDKFCEIPRVTQQMQTPLVAHGEFVYMQKNLTNVPNGTRFHPVPGGAVYETIAACMSRNRDLDGNGRIDQSEVRWFVPTENIYLQMILGESAMSTPLMDFKNVETLIRPTDNRKKPYDFTRFFYFSSDMRYVFANEGMSTAGLTQFTGNRDAATPWEVRCIRNLGASLHEISDDNDPVKKIANILPNTRIIKISGLVGEGFRSPIYRQWFKEHEITDMQNRLSEEFEYAANDCNQYNLTYNYWNIGVNGEFRQIDTNNRKDWTDNAVNENNICKYYHQEGNNDLGTWRLPNQRELAVMQQLGVLTTASVKWNSATKEVYGENGDKQNQRILGAKSNLITASMTNKNGMYRIRCVRDVVKK